MEGPAQIDQAADGTVRVVLSGTVLLIRYEDVLSQVERTMKARPCPGVQVDLAEVTSMDSSGVALLILVRRLAVRAAIEFRVLGASPEVLRHLEMVGLTAMFGLSSPSAAEGSITDVAEQPPEPAEDVVTVFDERFDRQGIQAIRDRLSRYATGCAVSGFELYKLLLAATEIMANVVVHGGGRGVIRAERQGDLLVLRVTDHGPGILRRHRRVNPRPHPGRIRSRGLWLARHVCERVDIDTGPDGTTVVLTYPLPPRAG